MSNTSIHPEFLRPKQVAELLGIHKATLESWWKRGRCPIPYTTLPSGHRRFKTADVAAYLETARTERGI